MLFMVEFFRMHLHVLTIGRYFRSSLLATLHTLAFNSQINKHEWMMCGES